MTTHPTPWTAESYGESVAIYDADHNMVETVYSVGGGGVERDALELAQRIVTAVNAHEAAS